ncbi:MAG: hypothetical protein ABEN55_20450, partial [Bradymonadaceae bacterium]
MDTADGTELDVAPSDGPGDVTDAQDGDTSEVGDTASDADAVETDVEEPEELECPTRPSVSGSTLYVSPEG